MTNIVRKVEENATNGIQKAQDIFKTPHFKAYLLFLLTVILSISLTHLENKNMKLSESNSKVKIIQEKLQSSQGKN